MLLDVESYAVSLDLTDPDVVRSHTEIRFRCLRPGAASFADVTAFPFGVSAERTEKTAARIERAVACGEWITSSPKT